MIIKEKYNKDKTKKIVLVKSNKYYNGLEIQIWIDRMFPSEDSEKWEMIYSCETSAFEELSFMFVYMLGYLVGGNLTKINEPTP